MSKLEAAFLFALFISSTNRGMLYCFQLLIPSIFCYNLSRKKESCSSNSPFARAAKSAVILFITTKKSLQQSQSYQRLFCLRFYFFHKSWNASTIFFKACSHLVILFVRKINPTKTRPSKYVEAMTDFRKSAIWQTVPPFSQFSFTIQKSISITFLSGKYHRLFNFSC